MTPFDGHAIGDATATFLGEKHRLLIDGAWVEGIDGETLETRDPATGLVLARFAIGGEADIDLAVAAARRAFEGPWSRLAAAERTALLARLARLVDQHATTLTELDVIDNGMPLARSADLGQAHGQGDGLCHRRERGRRDADHRRQAPRTRRQLRPADDLHRHDARHDGRA